MSRLNGRINRLEAVSGPAIDVQPILDPVAWHDAVGDLVSVWTFQPTGHLYEYIYKDGSHYYEDPRWWIHPLIHVARRPDYTFCQFDRFACYHSGHPVKVQADYLPGVKDLTCEPLTADWSDPGYELGPDQRLTNREAWPDLGGCVVVCLYVPRRYRNPCDHRYIEFEDRRPVGALMKGDYEQPKQQD